MKLTGRDPELGIPGTMTAVSLSLPANLTYERWAEVGRLLGRMGRGLQWWVGSWVLHGEAHFGERFAQALEETGYSTQSLLNILAVTRAFEASRRREALTFGHHEVVASLPEETQDRWLEWAVAGERLPNGETKAWSVKRLRQEIRAEGAPRRPRTQALAPLDDDPSRPAHVIVGTLLDIDGAGLCKVVAIYPKDAGLLLQCVRL